MVSAFPHSSNHFILLCGSRPDGQKSKRTGRATVKKDTRKQLIETGLEIFSKKGYNHTGIKEILETACVPKGSFYHYFKNKEDFGLQVIDYYMDGALAHMRSYLRDMDGSPLTRLRLFFENGCTMAETEQSRGCLIGNMSQELGGINSAFEKILNEKWRTMSREVTTCLRAARDKQEIFIEQDAEETADFLLSSWQGALIRMKVARTEKPLRTFMGMVFGRLLRKPATNPAL